MADGAIDVHSMRLDATRAAFHRIYAGEDLHGRAASIAEARRRGMPRTAETHDLTSGSMTFDGLHAGLAAIKPLARGGSFCDLGSGVGAAVIAAALLHPWKACIGVELMQDLHDQACQAHRKFEALRATLERPDNGRPLDARMLAQRMQFVCGDLFDVPLRELEAPAVIFCCCVTWPPDLMFRLARKLAEELDDGTYVLTVGKPMPHQVVAAGGGLQAQEAIQQPPSERVTFREIWHGMAQLDWGSETLVLHCTHRASSPPCRSPSASRAVPESRDHVAASQNAMATTISPTPDDVVSRYGKIKRCTLQ